jgi:hypothetical protein
VRLSSGRLFAGRLFAGRLFRGVSAGGGVCATLAVARTCCGVSPRSQVVWIGSNVDLSYTGARAALSNAYLNAGSCAWELFDGAGVMIADGVLSYDAGSNGDYYGVISAPVTSGLALDAPYTLSVTFASGDYDDERVVPLRAAYRTAA